MCQSQQISSDYLETLQLSALGFLQRHQAQHLSEQELFSRAVAFLVGTLKASQAEAENTVARAYGELRATNDGRHLDPSLSTGSLAMLVDPRSGQHFAVPVALIFEKLIDTQQRRRLSLVKPSIH